MTIFERARRNALQMARCAFGTAVLVVGCSAVAIAAEVHERAWQAHKSANFRLVTDLQTKDAVAYAGDLEMFRDVVLRVTGRRQLLAQDAPVEVMVFSRQKDFTALFGTRIYGFFESNLQGTRMVSGPGGVGVGKRQVLFHEYVHHLVNSSATVRYPRWYNEGMAEMLSTIHEKNGRIFVGSLPERAQNEPFVRMPITTLLNDEYEGLSPLLMNDFYASSWALVHYLNYGHLAGNPKRDQQMIAYLTAMLRGSSSEEAFASAFDITPLQLQSELQRYLERNRLPVLDYPRDNFEWDAQATSTALSPAQAAYEIANAVVSREPARARELFGSALQSPSADQALRGRALAGIAVAYRYESNYAAGYDAGRDAVAAAGTDAEPRRVLAELLLEWCESDARPATCEARIGEALTLYREGLELAPGDVRLSVGLARAQVARGIELESAFAVLAPLADTNSADVALNMFAGSAAIATGRTDRGVEYLRRVLHFSDDDEVRAKAESLLKSLATPATSELRAQPAEEPEAAGS
jgi:hypothetical protein